MADKSALTEQTKKDLTDAFFDIFENKHIEKISIKEITQRAGYCRNTFYRNFTSIYDLLEQVEDSLADSIGKYCEQYEGPNYDFRVQMILAICQINNRYIDILFKKNNESHFSSKLIEKCRPYWEKSYMLDADPRVREYTIEYKVVGSVAVLVKYFNKRDMPLEEILELASNLVSPKEHPV